LIFEKNSLYQLLKEIYRDQSIEFILDWSLRRLSAFIEKLGDAGVTSILEIYVNQLGSA